MVLQLYTFICVYGVDHTYEHVYIRVFVQQHVHCNVIGHPYHYERNTHERTVRHTYRNHPFDGQIMYPFTLLTFNKQGGVISRMYVYIDNTNHINIDIVVRQVYTGSVSGCVEVCVHLVVSED